MQSVTGRRRPAAGGTGPKGSPNKRPNKQPRPSTAEADTPSGMEGVSVEPHLPPQLLTSAAATLGLRNGPGEWGSLDDIQTLHECLGTGSAMYTASEGNTITALVRRLDGYAAKKTKRNKDLQRMFERAGDRFAYGVVIGSDPPGHFTALFLDNRVYAVADGADVHAYYFDSLAHPMPLVLRRCLYAAAAASESRLSIEDKLGTAVGGEPLQKDTHSCLVWAMCAETWFDSFVKGGGSEPDKSFGEHLADVSVGRDSREAERMTFVNQQRDKYRLLLLGYDAARVVEPRASEAQLCGSPGQLLKGQTKADLIDADRAFDRAVDRAETPAGGGDKRGGGELDSQGSPAQQEDPAKKRKKPKKEVDDLIDSNGARDKPTAARHGSRAKAAPSKDADFERAIQASQELDITMDCDGTDLTHDGCSKLLAGVQTLPAAQLRDLLICNKFPEPVQAFIGNQRLDRLVMSQKLKKVHDTLVVTLERKLRTMKKVTPATTATGAAATAAQQTSPNGGRVPPPPKAASGPPMTAAAAEQNADSAARMHSTAETTRKREAREKARETKTATTTRLRCKRNQKEAAESAYKKQSSSAARGYGSCQSRTPPYSQKALM